MSRENADVVRADFEAWNASDWDAFRELHDPEVILRNPEGWPERGPFVGREAVIRQFREARELWDNDKVEPISEFFEAADHVVVRMIWRGLRQGLDSQLEMTAIFTVRKHRIFGIEYFWDHEEALEAVGLRE